MPKSKTTQAALRWINARQAPAERALEVAFCTALLSEKVPLQPVVLNDREVGSDVLLATVLAAEEEQNWPLVELIRDHGTDKKSAKLAKKVLFRAEQRGHIQREKEPERRSVDLSSRAEAPPSYCTSFDRSGGQVVLYGGVTEADGAFGLIGIVNPAHGVESLSFVSRPSRKRMRQLAEDIARRFGGMVVEVDAATASGRLTHGLNTADEVGRSIDGDAGIARRLLQDTTPHDGIGEIQPPPENAEDLVKKSGSLAELPCFADWFSADRTATLQAAYAKLVPVEDESDEDRLTRATALVQEAVGVTLNAERRASLGIQLRITANLLRADNRADEAATADAVAHALTSDDTDPLAVPFVAAAVDVPACAAQLVK